MRDMDGFKEYSDKLNEIFDDLGNHKRTIGWLAFS